MKKDYYGELRKKLNALVARINYGGNYWSYFSVVPVPAGYAFLAQLCGHAEAAGMEDDEALSYVLRELRNEAKQLESQRVECYNYSLKRNAKARLLHTKYPERYDANGRRIRVRRAR